MENIRKKYSGLCEFMATVSKGSEKISKQVRGTENIFGYRSTTANQLYLLYCISGKIYFSEQVHPLVKYSWFSMNLYGVLAACTTGMACLLYDTKRNVWKLLDIATWIGVSVGLSINIPGIVYYYRNNIEATIQKIDELPKIVISKTRQAPHENIIDLTKLIIFNFYAMATLVIVYNFVSILDVVLFYDEKKFSDFKYYTMPLPNIEENGSGNLFVFSSLLLVFNAPLYGFLWIVVVTMISLWSAACHNELLYLKDSFDSRMNDMNLSLRNKYGFSQAGSRIFKRTLIQDIKAFNAIGGTINNFKGFVQLLSSFTIPVNFVSQTTQLFTLISTGMLLSVRIKVILFFIMAMWPMFLLYWVGQILENGVLAMSYSVFWSQWYRFVTVRKDVYIFLCQTQKSINFSMLKVYPLFLRNYSRLIYSLQSTVNLLRKIAST